MKKIISLLLLASLTACSQAEQKSENIAKSAEIQTACTDCQTLIIFFDPKIGDKPLLVALKEQNAELVYQYQNLNGVAVRVANDENLAKTMASLRKVEGVLSVEKDQVMQLQRH